MTNPGGPTGGDPAGDGRAVQVVQPGPLTLVQDAGRPGRAHLGVGASGAMDRAALALGNRLVGNPDDAAGLEILLGGVRLRFGAHGWIALTGAWLPAKLHGASADGGGHWWVEPHTATAVEPGDELELEAATHGIRGYLAVRGGIHVPPVLGSRSRDVLATLGPAPLAAGDLLPVGPEPADPVPPVDLVPVDPPPDGEVVLGIRPGPRRDWITDAAWDALRGPGWSVSPRSDRTGVRLDGPALDWVERRELPSEGMLPGAIQVSPDGAPTILGPDHPVTGGYPVAAVVVGASLDALAQLRPGQRVRLALVAGRA